MSDKSGKVFSGFYPESLQFLIDVRMNNSKEWFEANRKNYEKVLLKPFQSLVMDLGRDINAIDTLLDITPSVNKTISRIFRDTRFSKDKSLYRSTMWITFKRMQKEWRDSPTFFFEISPESYRYGMGFYSASSDSMDIFREMIDKNPKEFLDAISFYSGQKEFVVEGDRYKKLLNKDKPAEIQEWYNRKNLYIVRNCNSVQRLFEKELVEDLIQGFNLISPVYHYLCKVDARKLKSV